jgi:hypothetical protein
VQETDRARGVQAAASRSDLPGWTNGSGDDQLGHRLFIVELRMRRRARERILHALGASATVRE